VSDWVVVGDGLREAAKTEIRIGEEIAPCPSICYSLSSLDYGSGV
jgi:hypothetical protein